MKQEANILTASEGKEIYNLERPNVYGKRVKWGERDETIIEEQEEEMM